MKNYEIVCCAYDMEERLKTRGAGENNPNELGIEYNYMDLTASSATPEMDIANLTNEQVAQIKAQGDRRPTERAIARAMATQKEEEQQYE